MRPAVLRFLGVLSVALLMSGGILASCSEEPSLKIGFVGGLTGRVSGLGVAGRNGVQLAVEEINQAGGISGRKVELLVKDDKQNAEVAARVVGELIKADVVAIVGHMTSSMSMASHSLINQAEVVMISPTTKTNQLSGLDDYFLRITPRLGINAELTADYVTAQLHLKKFCVIYDTGNRAFTEDWLNSFKQALVSRGGEIICEMPFKSSRNVSFLDLAEEMLTDAPEAILVLSNAMDAALVAQQLRKLGSEVPLFASEWSFTRDVIHFGGKAVEGMSSFHSFDANSQKPRFQKFKAAYRARFGTEPSFASVLAYDAASCLIAALRKNPRRTGLKQALLSRESYPGLQSEIHFDTFGDTQRNLFLTTVKDGQFRVVDAP